MIPERLSSSPVMAPVSAHLCRQSKSFARWALWTTTLIQRLQAGTCLLNQMSEVIQKRAARMLPLFLYMSLLVLAIQAGAIIALFTCSFRPFGFWFLLTCILILGIVYVNTYMTKKRPVFSIGPTSTPSS